MRQAARLATRVDPRATRPLRRRRRRRRSTPSCLACAPRRLTLGMAAARCCHIGSSASVSKRQGQEIENQHSNLKRCSQYQYRKKHLYLVLDDWKKGFTIHKIDADSFDSRYHDLQDPSSDGVAVAGYLTEPPAVRLQAPGDDATMFFMALGNKIFIVTDACRGQTPALMFDTETTALAFGPRVPAQLKLGFDIVVAAGDALYGFATPPSNSGKNSLKVMSWKPSALDHYNHMDPSEEAWSWTSLPGPARPLDRLGHIISYAVHPDEHTIFMTTAFSDRPGLQHSTFSFNTESCEWKWHGWVLPFHGQGFFDRELDAWVGLHRDGYISSCRVPTDCGSTSPIDFGLEDLGVRILASRSPIDMGLEQLDCRILENKLFYEDSKRDMATSFTYMGESKFCLVKTLKNKEANEAGFINLRAPDGCVLQMTIFGLKYNHKGDLRATSCWSTRSYLVPKYKGHMFDPEAFWM